MEAAVQTVANPQDRIPGTRSVPRRRGLALPERDERTLAGQPLEVVTVVVRPLDRRVGQQRRRRQLQRRQQYRRRRRRRRRIRRRHRADDHQEAQPHDTPAPDTAHLRAGHALGRAVRGEKLSRDHRRCVHVTGADPSPSPGRLVAGVPVRGRRVHGLGTGREPVVVVRGPARPSRQLQRALGRDVVLHDHRGRRAQQQPRRARSLRQLDRRRRPPRLRGPFERPVRRTAPISGEARSRDIGRNGRNKVITSSSDIERFFTFGNRTITTRVIHTGPFISTVRNVQIYKKKISKLC